MPLNIPAIIQTHPNAKHLIPELQNLYPLLEARINALDRSKYSAKKPLIIVSLGGSTATEFFVLKSIFNELNFKHFQLHSVDNDNRVAMARSFTYLHKDAPNPHANKTHLHLVDARQPERVKSALNITDQSPQNKADLILIRHPLFALKRGMFKPLHDEPNCQFTPIFEETLPAIAKHHAKVLVTNYRRAEFDITQKLLNYPRINRKTGLTDSGSTRMYQKETMRSDLYVTLIQDYQPQLHDQTKHLPAPITTPALTSQQQATAGALARGFFATAVMGAAYVASQYLGPGAP